MGFPRVGYRLGDARVWAGTSGGQCDSSLCGQMLKEGPACGK